MHLLLYQRDHTGFSFTVDYVMEDGFPLGAWAEIAQEMATENILWADEMEKLASIGFSLDATVQSWESMYCYARNYYDLHKTLPPRDYVMENGAFLGAWVERQRMFYATYDEKRKRKLQKIHIGEFGWE